MFSELRLGRKALQVTLASTIVAMESGIESAFGVDAKNAIALEIEQSHSENYGKPTLPATNTEEKTS